MTSENPLVIRCEISQTLAERAQAEARREGKDRTPKQWLEMQAQKFLARLAAADTDLKPKEAARLLGISLWTLRREMSRGNFPHMYYVNPRVLRIPMNDVEQYRQARSRSLG